MAYAMMFVIGLMLVQVGGAVQPDEPSLPVWFSPEQVSEFNRLYRSGSPKGVVENQRRLMDTGGKIPISVKKAIWEPGVDSWMHINKDKTANQAKPESLFFEVDKRAFDFGKGFWKGEKEALDSWMKESKPGYGELGERLVKLTRDFNELYADESEMTLSFFASLVNTTSRSEAKSSICLVAKFYLWDSRFNADERRFLCTATNTTKNAEVPTGPFYMQLGKNPRIAQKRFSLEEYFLSLIHI